MSLYIKAYVPRFRSGSSRVCLPFYLRAVAFLLASSAVSVSLAVRRRKTSPLSVTQPAARTLRGSYVGGKSQNATV